MIAPIKRRNTEGRLRGEQHPDDPDQRARQRHDDDKRIEPGLEVHDHQQIDQQRGEHQADAEIQKGRLHALHLPLHGDRIARRERLLILRDDLVDLGGDGAEVAALHVGVDIVDRLNVGVGDDLRRGAPAQRRHVAEQRRLRAALEDDPGAL